MGSPPRARPLKVADAAGAMSEASLVDVNGRTLERVPVSAVGLLAVADSLVRVHAARDVLGLRDGLEVGGVHAAASAAEMVDGHAIRNRPYRQLIGGTMREDASASVVVMAEEAVSLGVEGARPKPALAFDGDLGHKPFRQHRAEYKPYRRYDVTP